VIEKSNLIFSKGNFNMKLHEEFKLYENMWDTVYKNQLSEELTTLYSSTKDKFLTFQEVHFSTDLDILIKALRAAGCTELELNVLVDQDEEELPEFYLEVKDIYKLDKRIPKNAYIQVSDVYAGDITGFVGVSNFDTDLFYDSYALDDIDALTNDIIRSLKFLEII
jgi:hypothetical protein